MSKSEKKSPDVNRHSIDGAALLAVLSVVIGMFALYKTLALSTSGDWLGYAEIYRDRGGWLLGERRDPGFLLVISIARAVLGSYGYSSLRTILSIGFVLFAVWLVRQMPVQTRLVRLSPFSIALVVFSALALKSFVQIREGLAFLFIVAPIVAMFAKCRSGIIASCLGTIVGMSLHIGTIIFGGVWIIALCMMITPDRLLASRVIQTIMLLISLIIGFSAAIYITHFASDVRFILRLYGVNTKAETISSVYKDIYWLLNGLFALKVRSELLAAFVGLRRFAFCYGSALASVALPMTYAICLALVISGFGTPSLTSIAIRLFTTVTELSLIIISLRGRIGILTATISFIMLIDQIRVFQMSD